MDGIILAALALLSVPVLLVVILVKVCGLENKVTDLALKLTVIDFTQRHKDTENIVSASPCDNSSGSTDLTQRHVTAAQAGLAIRSEPSRAERVPRDTE